MKVRRKNGLIEDFQPEKIVNAIMKAGGTPELARAIAKDVEGALSKDVPFITTLQIRTEVLNRLKTMDLVTYNSWIAYDEKNKKESAPAGTL